MAEEQGSLTYWLQKRKATDPMIRDEAWQRIMKALDSRRRSIAPLDPKVAARVGASDVRQEALMAALQADGSFSDRNAFFAWFDKILNNTWCNSHRDHHRLMRDVRREVSPASPSDSDLDAAGDLLERGKRLPLVEAPAQHADSSDDAGNAPAIVPDSFFKDDPRRQATYGDQPIDAAAYGEAFDCIQAFDAERDDCLLDVLRYSVEGYSADEIAGILSRNGRSATRRTVERKRRQIGELLGFAKLVYVAIPRSSDLGDCEERDTLIFPRVSSAQLLARIGHDGKCLFREAHGTRPEHFFAPTDNLYNFIEPSDRLQVRSLEA